MYIAVDFDGTCVTHDFPEVGKSVGAESVLLALTVRGHLIILNTMRSGEDLDPAVSWFKDRGIRLFGINNNPTQNEWTNSPKVYAHMYIDDAALGTPLIYGEHVRPYVDWEKVQFLLEERGLL